MQSKKNVGRPSAYSPKWTDYLWLIKAVSYLYHNNNNKKKTLTWEETIHQQAQEKAKNKK